MNKFDVIVVGSGPAGVSSAYPLIKGGLKVAIVDVGLKGDNIFEKTNKILRIKSNLPINQSLAKGGLSEVWPGICDYFSEEELTKMGLPAQEVINEYSFIENFMKLTTPRLDIYTRTILKSCRNIYSLKIANILKTSKVINKFLKYKNFTYINNSLVKKISEKDGTAEVHAILLDSGNETSYKAKFIISAAGSINTNRIILRSANNYNKRVPFLTKNNYMFVCFLPKILFKSKPKQFFINQVALNTEKYFIQFYRCNPKTLEKALEFVKLPKKITLGFLKLLSPFLIIADVRFESKPGKNKFLELKNDKEEILHINFNYTKNELNDHRKSLSKIKTKLLSFGILPLKMVTGVVTSHYGGGVTTDQSGKLINHKRIYVADSSTWNILPAKPPTLTLMANAARIGKNILKNERF